MKKYLKYVVSGALVCAAAFLSSPSAFADDQLDSEGYPVMYVRGSMTNSWSCLDSYRFSRDGDTYTISLPELDGQFKIAGTDWKCEYGAFSYDFHVTDAVAFTGVYGGPNIFADNLHNVVISFTLNRVGETVANTIIRISVNGKEAPFEEPKPYDKYLSGTLPVLYINVYGEDGKTYNDEIIDRNLAHKDYFTGEYWLDLNGCEWMKAEGAKSVGSAEEPLPLEIKARGNYTRTGFAKKPFKLKLGKKQALCGLTKSKHFAILAHADDYLGYLRNFVGFNLGRRIELPWTPWQQPVEVVINGDYRGLYFLTESIRIEEERINITELADNATEAAEISGGYLVELDNYDEENQIRMEEKTFIGNMCDELRITWDTPEIYSDIQKQFVTEQFAAMNDNVGANSDRLWSYMDLDDAARYYLVEEMISHTEAYHGSTYMFRDRGEGQKWHFSPLWDCGNAFRGPVDNHFFNTATFGNTWIPSMVRNDKFMDKVRDTWKWFMSNKFDGIFADIDAYVEHIKAAAKCDHERWKNAPMPDSPNRSGVCDNTDMDSRRSEVLSHFNRKLSWMKDKFGDYSGRYAEPARDTTPAAALPEYAVSSAIGSVSAEACNAPAVYYNLQGMRVDRPAAGQLYIVRRGSETAKVIF